MKVWAASGCAGPAPTGKQAERQAIALKMAGTNATAAAAIQAAHDVSHELGQVNDRLRAIDDQIEVAVLDVMHAEFMVIFDQHRIAVEGTRALTAKLTGLTSFLSNHGREQIEVRNNIPAGRRYLARSETLTGKRFTDPGITHSEIFEGVAFWASRSAALRRGS